MNCMCNLTQFIVSYVTHYTDATNLVFISGVILVFGMCSVFIIDNVSIFKSGFIDMCKALQINHWCLSRDNHKENKWNATTDF